MRKREANQQVGRSHAQARRAQVAARGIGLAALGMALATGLAFAIVRLVRQWYGLPPKPVRHRRRPASVAVPTSELRMPLKVSGGAGALLAAGLGLVVLLLVAGAAEAWVYDRRPDDFHQPLPGPRLIGAERLTGYHWIDQEAGLVQIPIEHAMDLIAERGLPTRDEGAGGLFRDAGLGGPPDSSGGR